MLNKIGIGVSLLCLLVIPGCFTAPKPSSGVAPENAEFITCPHCQKSFYKVELPPIRYTEE